MLAIVLPAFVMTTVKVLLVILSMVGMIFVYVAIGKLSHVDEQPNAHAAEFLRADVEQSQKVISEDSVFHNFLARGGNDTKILSPIQEETEE